MSAFLTTSTTRNVIANYIETDTYKARALSHELHTMNVEALTQRYGDDPTTQERHDYRADDTAHPAQVYRSMSCWLYQCAEGDCPKSDLYDRIRGAREQLADELLRQSDLGQSIANAKYDLPDGVDPATFVESWSRPGYTEPAV